MLDNGEHNHSHTAMTTLAPQQKVPYVAVEDQMASVPDMDRHPEHLCPSQASNSHAKLSAATSAANDSFSVTNRDTHLSDDKNGRSDIQSAASQLSTTRRQASQDGERRSVNVRRRYAPPEGLAVKPRLASKGHPGSAREAVPPLSSMPVRATYADLYAETGLPSPRQSQSNDTDEASNAHATRSSRMPLSTTQQEVVQQQPPKVDLPLNVDALIVQKTYARIDEIGGIPRDGFVEGEELTRERRTQASINGYLDLISLAASWGPSTSASTAGTDQLALPNTARRKSEGASTSLLSVNDIPNHNAPRLRKASAVSRAASHKSPQEEASELQLLQKVDRYGFFTPSYLTTTSGRLVLLAKEPCLDIPRKLDSKKSLTKGKQRTISDSSSRGPVPSPYIQVPSGSAAGRNGGTTPHNGSRQSSLAPPSPNMSASTSLSSISSQANLSISQSESSGSKETVRISKWFDEMLVPARRDEGGNVVAWTFSEKIVRNDKKLQRRIRKGIPDRWRLAAWEALLLRMRAKTKKGQELQSLERRFYNLILEPCQHDVQIDLDVPRTISGHLLFHTRYGLGQRGLFNVLHAFATYCPECGYCQGMGSLAATFLCYVPPEKAYAYMTYLHDSYDLHTIFKPGFPGMLECFHIQEQLVKQLMPDVHDIFEKHYISISSFATKWYITLFVNVVPFSTQLRLWDLFLLWGKNALIITSTALIWTLRQHLTQPTTDFEKVLSLLSSYFIPADEDAFIRWIGKMAKRDDVQRLIAEAAANFREQRSPSP